MEQIAVLGYIPFNSLYKSGSQNLDVGVQHKEIGLKGEHKRGDCTGWN